jgi:hypothetical protein
MNEIAIDYDCLIPYKKLSIREWEPLVSINLEDSMKRIFVILVLALVTAVYPLSVAAQQETEQEKAAFRAATRERLRSLLETSGPKKGINISFRQAEKQPFNFVGVKRDGLTNSDSMEVVVGVSNDKTIGFRIFPHYRGSYINLDKAGNGTALMRQLLNFNDSNFLFWGADSSNDIFAGYTFTLESGFPDKAIEIVLYSISPLDKFVGQMRPNIDGAPAQ